MGGGYSIRGGGLIIGGKDYPEWSLKLQTLGGSMVRCQQPVLPVLILQLLFRRLQSLHIPHKSLIRSFRMHHLRPLICDLLKSLINHHVSRVCPTFPIVFHSFSIAFTTSKAPPCPNVQRFPAFSTALALANSSETSSKSFQRYVEKNHGILLLSSL